MTSVDSWQRVRPVPDPPASQAGRLDLLVPASPAPEINLILLFAWPGAGVPATLRSPPRAARQYAAVPGPLLYQHACSHFFWAEHPTNSNAWTSYLTVMMLPKTDLASIFRDTKQTLNSSLP